MAATGLDEAKVRENRDQSIDVRLEEGADARWQLMTVVATPKGEN